MSDSLHEAIGSATNRIAQLARRFRLPTVAELAVSRFLEAGQAESRRSLGADEQVERCLRRRDRNEGDRQSARAMAKPERSRRDDAERAL